MASVKSFPLQWPTWQPRTEPSRIERARFGTHKGGLTVAAGIKRVLNELRLMGIHDGDTIISSNVPTRLSDGLPRSMRGEPADTGVAVYFKRDTADLATYAFACDKWDRVSDNLAAVAAHAGSLRGQIRWGVGSQEQAFMGYRALSAPDTKKPWWEALGFESKPKDPDAVKLKYRELARIHHPDMGGNPDQMAEISAAYEEFMFD